MNIYMPSLAKESTNHRVFADSPRISTIALLLVYDYGFHTASINHILLFSGFHTFENSYLESARAMRFFHSSISRSRPFTNTNWRISIVLSHVPTLANSRPSADARIHVPDALVLQNPYTSWLMQHTIINQHSRTGFQRGNESLEDLDCIGV